uniref:Uncharacterized protein n=1 Tax=Magallana gigas TaxID=29159 RepID=K1PTH2_MAGGI
MDDTTEARDMRRPILWKNLGLATVVPESLVALCWSLGQFHPTVCAIGQEGMEKPCDGCEQRWRETEDVGLPSCLRVCTQLKGKISHLSSLDVAEADKLSAVYDELCTTINVMAQDHKEYISNIYNKPSF